MTFVYKAPAALEQWLAASPFPAAAQYKDLVLRFLEHDGVVDLSKVELAALVLHVQSFDSADVRRKTASALSRFFADLAQSGSIPSNPASQLVATLKEERSRKKVRSELEAAGMSEEDVARLTWRDIARVVLGTGSSRVPPERMPPSDSDVMSRLAKKFLSRMKSCPPESFENLLDRSIDG